MRDLTVNSKFNNKAWLDSMLREQTWTHALTLNYTTARNSSRWLYTCDKDNQAKLQDQAEALMYTGLLRIKQQLYGPRCYKRQNMNKFVVYEYGDKENKLHAHCLLDLSDYAHSDDQLTQAVKRGICKSGGIANNEWDLQSLYTMASGYGWIDYISKHVDYNGFTNIDWRNSTIN
jgi:hypothetical protein